MAEGIVAVNLSVSQVNINGARITPLKPVSNLKQKSPTIYSVSLGMCTYLLSEDCVAPMPLQISF